MLRAQEHPEEYYPPETYVRGNAIITIYRPILTDEERARRMKKIEASAAALIREKIEVERRKGLELKNAVN